MGGWHRVALSQIVHPAERSEEPVGGTEYRQIGVRLWGQGAYERESIDGSQTKYSRMFRVAEGDIIVNKIWARNGSVAVVSKELDGCYASSEFPMFAPDRTNLLPQWFHWFTKTQDLWRQCDEKSRGTSGKNRIRPERFLEVTIPLPPLAEQQRILARIDALASRIEEAKKLRAQAVAEVEALYNSEVSQIRNALEHRYGVRRLASLIINAGYGTSTKCSYDHELGTLPVLRIPNVVSESIDRADLKYGRIAEPEHGRVMLTAGDILIVRTNGSAELVGRSAVVESVPEPTAFASYLIRIQCDTSSVRPHYMQRMLRHLRTSGQLFDLARTTAGQYNVSLGRLREATIPLPPFELQDQFVNRLDSLQGKLDAVKRLQAETQAELNALLPAVLDRAFRGEL